MSPSSSRRSAVVPAALALGTVALLAVPAGASAAPARTTFDLPLPGTGTPSEVAAADGTVGWLTVDAGATTLYVQRPGMTATTTRVATTPGTTLGRLSVGSDVAGTPVVLAIRSRASARSSRSAGADVVRIDPATGAVSPVPVAAKRSVEETAAAVQRGVLVLSRRAQDGKGRAAIYRTTLRGTRLTFLRPLTELPAKPAGFRSVDVDELAIAPGTNLTTGLRVAVRTVGTAEFGSQAIYVVRPSGTPRLVVSWSDGGAGTSRSIGGLSWETDSRLWYADADERNAATQTPFASRVVRYSARTHRQAEVRTTATVEDLAWADATRGAVGVVRDSTAKGVSTRLGASGPLKVASYTPRR